MAYLSVPTRRGSLFKSDQSTTLMLQQKLARKTEEYHNRNTRKSNVDDEDHITLNIGGTLFKTRKSTLRNVPSTKLALLDENSDCYDADENEYYFDRNPFIFGYLLDYYRTGNMHIPREVCSTAIKEELKFWDLGDGCISECCRKYYFNELDEFTTYELIKAEFYHLPTYTTRSESLETISMETNFQHFRRKAWVFIDNHESSDPAKVFAVIYYGLVMLSILSLFISTIPSVRVPLEKHILIRSANDTLPSLDYAKSLGGTLTVLLTTDPPDVLVIFDMVSMFFFTVEFVFRMMVCPSLLERLKSWYTLLDLIYIIPAWAKLLIDVLHPFYWQTGSDNTVIVLVIFDALLVSRVLRIFRLSRHYRGLRVLLLSIKASVSELTLLVVFIMFSLTIYASFMYCAEHYNGKENTFDSIFIGLWWALITLTTVGYGDFYPQTTVGYIIACFCAVTGLLIIGMVVPIIAGNFHLYYGFRHAGCEDIVLGKPEFVPSESENPFPETDVDVYARKMTKPLSKKLQPSDKRVRKVNGSCDTINSISIQGSMQSFQALPMRHTQSKHKLDHPLLSTIRQGSTLDASCLNIQQATV